MQTQPLDPAIAAALTRMGFEPNRKDGMTYLMADKDFIAVEIEQPAGHVDYWITITIGDRVLHTRCNEGHLLQFARTTNSRKETA